jgi:DNA modification methylase
VELGCEYVGIELDPKYVEIAEKRIAAWNKQDTAFNELFE